MLVKIDGVTVKGLDRKDLMDSTDEKVAKPLLLGQVIGKALTNPADGAGNSVKIYELGQKFYDCKDFEIDSSDADLVKKLIEGSGIVSVLIKGQAKLLLRGED